MEQDNDAELYDLAPTPAAPPPPARPEAAMSRPPAPAATPTLHYRRTDPSRPATDTETLRNLYMPIWLLGGGVVVELAAAFLRYPHAPQIAVQQLGVNMVLGTVLMLAGVLLAAKLRSIHLGSFWIAVLKVAALSVAPGAAMELAGPMLGLVPILGGLAALLLEVVLYFALLGAMFDLDESDTWYCLCVVFLVRIAVGFGAMALLGRWL